jgi:hypothetical protein
MATGHRDVACTFGRMIGVGLLLMFVGFAVVTPRGAMPGGAAHRNVSAGPGHLVTTRGYVEEGPRGWWRFTRPLIGVALLVTGLALIMLAG